MSNSNRSSTCSTGAKQSSSDSVQAPANARSTRARKVISYVEPSDDENEDEDDEMSDVAGLPYPRAVKQPPGVPVASPSPQPAAIPTPATINYTVDEINAFSALNAQQQDGVLRMVYDRFEDELLRARFQGTTQDWAHIVQDLWLSEHLSIGEILDKLSDPEGYNYFDVGPEELLLYLRWSTVFWLEPIHHM